MARKKKRNLPGKFFGFWRQDGLLPALDYSCQFARRAGGAWLFRRLCRGPAPLSLLSRLSPFAPGSRKKAESLIADLFTEACPPDPAPRLLKRPAADLAGGHVALLAHRDPDGKVDDYVRHQAGRLRELGCVLICCTASPGADENHDWADGVVHVRHASHDAACWQAGAAALPGIFSAESVTLATDRAFGPLGSWEPVYRAMRQTGCDFWGLASAGQRLPGLDTLHLVLGARALRHPALLQFFGAIRPTAEKADKQLRALPLWLELAGLAGASYVAFPPICGPRPLTKFWRQLVKNGFPLFPRSLLDEGRQPDIRFWHDELRKRGYPVGLIVRHYYRLGRDLSATACVGRRPPACPPNIMLRQQAVTLPPDPGPAAAAPDLGIFVHSWYDAGFAQISPWLAALPRQAALYISTDSEAKAARLRREAAALGFARMEVRVMPNRGWDIAPFLAGFGQELAAHRLILKVHVKLSSYMQDGLGDEWRDTLYQSLMGGEAHVRRILALFAQRPRLGMLAPPTFQAIDDVSSKCNFRNLKRLLGGMGLAISPGDAIDFPAGSMFWARSDALRPLLDLKLDFEDFAPPDTALRDGTLAHAVERSFFYSCHAAGLDWGRVPPPPYLSLAPMRPCDLGWRQELRA